MLSHLFFFFFNDTATTEIYTRFYTLSLHDALPIYTVFQDYALFPHMSVRDNVAYGLMEIGRAHV